RPQALGVGQRRAGLERVVVDRPESEAGADRAVALDLEPGRAPSLVARIEAIDPAVDRSGRRVERRGRAGLEVERRPELLRASPKSLERGIPAAPAEAEARREPVLRCDPDPRAICMSQERRPLRRPRDRTRPSARSARPTRRARWG